VQFIVKDDFALADRQPRITSDYWTAHSRLRQKIWVVRQFVWIRETVLRLMCERFLICTVGSFRCCNVAQWRHQRSFVDNSFWSCVDLDAVRQVGLPVKNDEQNCRSLHSKRL